MKIKIEVNFITEKKCIVFDLCYQKDEILKQLENKEIIMAKLVVKNKDTEETIHITDYMPKIEFFKKYIEFLLSEDGMALKNMFLQNFNLIHELHEYNLDMKNTFRGTK